MTSQIRQLHLLPPAPNACQECARIHGADEPHDANSLYYQLHFKLEQGRDPTWADAMVHCSEATKAAWIAELKERGIEV